MMCIFTHMYTYMQSPPDLDGRAARHCRTPLPRHCRRALLVRTSRTPPPHRASGTCAYGACEFHTRPLEFLFSGGHGPADRLNSWIACKDPGVRCTLCTMTSCMRIHASILRLCQRVSVPMYACVFAHTITLSLYTYAMVPCTHVSTRQDCVAMIKIHPRTCIGTHHQTENKHNMW